MLCLGVGAEDDSEGAESREEPMRRSNGGRRPVSEGNGSAVPYSSPVSTPRPEQNARGEISRERASSVEARVSSMCAKCVSSELQQDRV